MDETTMNHPELAENDTAAAAMRRAREIFLDDANVHGCAETAFIVLKEAYGLPDAADSSAAMALNGGVAYRGGPCGAITGAALAVGMLAERRLDDHRRAKRAARLVIGHLFDDFGALHGSTACRDLIGLDISTEAGHRAFIESGTWRDRCMRQVEWVVERLAPLAGPGAWAAALAAVEGPEAGPGEPGPVDRGGTHGDPAGPGPGDARVPCPGDPAPAPTPSRTDPRTLPA